MKIVLVAQEFPFPPNHGGRVDTWNRIKALKKHGAEIFFVTWVGVVKNDFPSELEISEVKKYTNHLKIFKIRRDFKRALALLKSPSLIAARSLNSSERESLLLELKIFNPQMILADGLYASEIGLWLKKALNLKLGIRSHNIEHFYMRGQFKLANNFNNKLSILLALLHLRRFEYKSLSSADYVFDISINDLNFWKNEGLTNGIWLGPTRMHTDNKLECSFSEEVDIAFFGNLNTPNNKEAIKWFLSKVLPIINSDDLKILVMGSNPSLDIKKMLKDYSNILLVENPIEPQFYLEKVKVLINPVQFGSGVNIKSVDMLFQNCHVVSTSIGVQGLPSEISDIFEIADNEFDFADKILKCLSTPIDFSRKDRKENLRKMFEESNVKVILDVLGGHSSESKNS